MLQNGNITTVDYMPSSFNHLGTHLFKKKKKVCVHALYVPDTIVGAGDKVGNKIHKDLPLRSLRSSMTLSSVQM